MSGSRLVRSSRDLTRLVQEGYAVRVVSGFLVVDDIPFVNDAGEVHWGSFLCPLDLAGDTTARPKTHVMCFVGGVPRDKNGAPISDLVNDGVERWTASAELTAACGFSQKPDGGYPDFYEKVVSYVAMVVGHAQAIQPDATPLTFKPVQTDEDDGVFRYVDTFSSRSGITDLNERLALNKVVIIGLGGTGSYLLDLLAKTPATAIHLYDGDDLRSHNAFRSPGAASVDDLRARLKKVTYYEQMYAPMRRGVVPHAVHVTEENLGELIDADFVFLTMDSGPDKKNIIEFLTKHDLPFIDTGVGLSKDGAGVNGQVRVTASTSTQRDHVNRDGLISYFAGEDAEYDTNLQVVELNAITANFAVIKYKKMLGFYADVEVELHTVYVVDSNEIHNRYGSSDARNGDGSAAPTYRDEEGAA